MNQQWKDTPKKIDPDFEGSAYQALGLTQFLCPTCGAHLKQSATGDGLICLNACHLVDPDSSPAHKAWLVENNADLMIVVKNIYNRKYGRRPNGNQ